MSSEPGRIIRQELFTALASLGGAVAKTVEAGIYPLVEKYAKQETTAGSHLGSERGHSGSTAKDLKAYRDGKSLLASRIQFWQEMLGNRANSLELFKKLSADALILLIELILREIRAKANLDSGSEKPQKLKDQNLLPYYYLLGITNLRLYQSNYGGDSDDELYAGPGMSTGVCTVKNIIEKKGSSYEIEYTISYDIYEEPSQINQAASLYLSKNRGKKVKIKEIELIVNNIFNAKLALLIEGKLPGKWEIEKEVSKKL